MGAEKQTIDHNEVKKLFEGDPGKTRILDLTQKTGQTIIDPNKGVGRVIVSKPSTFGLDK